jgi:predicted nucleic acid-binding Zn ribbon protein
MKGSKKKSGRLAGTAPLREAIEAMMEHYRIKDKFDEKKLISSWEQIVGAPIARRTEKLYMRNKVLYVHLSSAPLRQELTNSRDKVLRLLHEHISPDLLEEVKFL